MVKFNEGDRVEYNGWLGSIRELDEDRIIIETEDGVINFDDDEDAKIDPEFRFLSLRGIYEHVRNDFAVTRGPGTDTSKLVRDFQNFLYSMNRI